MIKDWVILTPPARIFELKLSFQWSLKNCDRTLTHHPNYMTGKMIKDEILKNKLKIKSEYSDKNLVSVINTYDLEPLPSVFQINRISKIFAKSGQFLAFPK